MNKMALYFSASTGTAAMGFIIFVFGILGLFIGPNSHESNILRGGACMTLGLATLALGIERLSNFKLNTIHEWLGPYGSKTLTLSDIWGYVLQFFGVCGYIGGTILLAFSLLRQLSVENIDLSIVLLAVGLALSSLGRMHADNRKYDDIAKSINSMYEDVAAIKEKSVKITEQLEILDKNIDEKRTEHYETNNISDFMPHGEIPPGLEC